MYSQRDKINKTPEVEEAYAKFSAIRELQLYRHIKSGKEYVFAGLRKAKFNDEWYDMVDYYHEPDSIPRHQYSRTTLNFDKSFEIIAGQYAYN
jgi:hypothetical protein